MNVVIALNNGIVAFAMQQAGYQFNASPPAVAAYLSAYQCLYWTLRVYLVNYGQGTNVLDQFVVDPGTWQSALAVQIANTGLAGEPLVALLTQQLSAPLPAFGPGPQPTAQPVAQRRVLRPVLSEVRFGDYTPGGVQPTKAPPNLGWPPPKPKK